MSGSGLLQASYASGASPLLKVGNHLYKISLSMASLNKPSIFFIPVHCLMLRTHVLPLLTYFLPTSLLPNNLPTVTSWSRCNAHATKYVQIRHLPRLCLHETGRRILYSSRVRTSVSSHQISCNAIVTSLVEF